MSKRGRKPGFKHSEETLEKIRQSKVFDNPCNKPCVYKGTRYDSLARAALRNSTSKQLVRYYINSSKHKDCYYL